MSPLHSARREPRRLDGDSAPLLILLHGYGSNEADLLGLVDFLDPRFRTVSVRAPLSLDMGVNAWFPIHMTGTGLDPDYAAADESLGQLSELLTSEQAEYGNTAADTFLLGFSQGAAMALGLLLTRPEAVGGVAFLSGLWSRARMPADASQAGVRGKPVLQTHGVADPLIPLAAAQASRDMLQELGVDLTYREYGMGHQIDGDCLRDIGTWLSERLPSA
jgi:phospholipase/carboxylesterase